MREGSGSSAGVMPERDAGTLPLVARVYAQLADGQFHSGEQLARALQVTRSAVWKGVGTLRDLGVEMQAIRSKGYRLEASSEPLDARRIREQLSQQAQQAVSWLEAEWSTDSTNSVLALRPNPPLGESEVMLAEFQTAGRGRRGRQWIAPPGGAICLSLSWTFRQMPRDAGALSLAIGVCVLRALQARGVEQVQLKWPNDILVRNRKLGGILIELRAESAGPAYVVVGIGLNVALGKALLERIAALGLPAADLASVSGGPVSRNAVAAALIGSCIEGLRQFEQEGLRPFVDEWGVADALRGHAVEVKGAGQGVRGIARGIDISGALLVDTHDGVEKILSGEVSVRPVE